MIQFDSKTLKQFEDLLDDESVAVNFEEKENLEDEEALMNKLDANSLTLKDLLHEMEMRNLQPRGFFEDDAKLLQEQLDKEHEEYLELKQRQKIEAKELEASQALVRRRKALQEIELGEEKREYGCNKRTSEWFRLLENKCSPSRCRIDINNVSARTLSRILWSDTLIVTLDVCNMYIADHAGSYLARVLKNNKSLIKLEMDENNLGYKTCNTLADSLGTNSTLKYLSLGSNPLTANNGKEVVESLAKILVENKSLQYLGLWRCNIGIEGGRKVSEAMQSNKDILCFELGYNFWDYKEIQNIQHVLMKNRKYASLKKKEEMELKQKKMYKLKLQEKQIEACKKKEMDMVYLSNQKAMRSEFRREYTEGLDEETIRDDEKRREDDKLKKLELEEVKKKKKSKKKKKKK